MDYLSAKQCVKKFINDRYSGSDELVILDAETIERSFGWIFFYDSKKFIETGELTYALAGNAPIIFDNRDGTIHVTGTSTGIDFYIAKHQENYVPNCN
ncbi:Immunity protein 35 [compost metagenome]